MRARVDELASPWLQPISAAARAGGDARHEPEHEFVRAEIGKLSGMRDLKVDWARVEQSGTRLLTTKAKDLVIATYVACALHEQGGLAGLARGTALLTGLLTNFAQELFPARPRARANALEWFGERCAARLTEAAGHSAEELALLRGLTLLLNEAAQTALGNETPSLRPLMAAIERLGLSIAETGTAPTVPNSAAPTDPRLAAAAPEPPSPGTTGTTEAGRPDEGATSLRARLHAEAAPWLTPISDKEPAGEDTSYTDRHARVRTQIQKLESPAGQRPDWQLVFAETDALLRTQSKDLVLATYLTAALWETRKLEGLALGMTTLCALVERYWDAMWPTAARPRRRANALTWLIERLAPQVAGAVTLANDTAALDALDADARRLFDLLATRLGEDAPVMRPLLDAISRLQSSAVAAAVRAVPTPPAAHAPMTSAAQAESRGGATQAAAPLGDLPHVAAVVPAPQDLTDVTAFLRQTGASLVDAAQMLRASDPTNPRAYRLLRAGLWLHVDGLPPADGQGRTRIPPPDKRAREAVEAFFASAKWEPLLAQAEGMAARTPFWLDAHFFAAHALEHLGDHFASARLALTSEVRGLSARLPGLSQLRFSDGTPLGSTDTLAWLRPAASGGSAPMHPASAVPSLPEGLRAGLIRGEASAFREFETLLNGTPALRARFGLRFELGQALDEAGRLDQALATYLGLEHDVDAHGIERWEPELAESVLKALWSAMQRSALANGVVHPETARVCARLARLYPTALL